MHQGVPVTVTNLTCALSTRALNRACLTGMGLTPSLLYARAVLLGLLVARVVMTG